MNYTRNIYQLISTYKKKNIVHIGIKEPDKHLLANKRLPF